MEYLIKDKCVLWSTNVTNSLNNISEQGVQQTLLPKLRKQSQVGQRQK